MSEPTEPTTPRTPQGAARPPQDPAVQGSQPAAPSAPPAATQPLPAVSAAAGAGPGAPGGPGGPRGPGAPTGPGDPVGPGAPVGPKQPGLWRQATSTTGGTIAVIVAGCLAALMVLALVGVVGLVAVRAIGHGDRADRVERVRDGGALPPGQQKKLDRLPQGPQAPRGQGNGMGNGMGNGIGPLMREAMALGNLQHGEFTVQENDKATVMTLQRGEVTKASDTSITVKSADDFTATYVVADDTRVLDAGTKVGDSVLVVAEKTGAKAVLVVANRKG